MNIFEKEALFTFLTMIEEKMFCEETINLINARCEKENNYSEIVWYSRACPALKTYYEILSYDLSDEPLPATWKDFFDFFSYKKLSNIHYDSTVPTDKKQKITEYYEPFINFPDDEKIEEFFMYAKGDISKITEELSIDILRLEAVKNEKQSLNKNICIYEKVKKSRI